MRLKTRGDLCSDRGYTVWCGARASVAAGVALLFTTAAKAQPWTPPTPRPRSLVVIDSPTYVATSTDVGSASAPASCAVYTGAVQTGVNSPAGQANPGTCRYTDLQFMIDGTPAEQYIQSLVSGGALPYTTTHTRPSIVSSCALATHFHAHVSAQVHTSALHWQDGRTAASACAIEAARHDPASLVPATDVQAAVNDLMSDFAQDLRSQFVTNGPVESCGLVNVLADTDLAQKVQQELRAIVAAEQARWNVSRDSIEGPPTQTKCAVQCNQCDFPGWAGTIVRNVIMRAPAYGFAHTETDTFFVGGPQQMTGSTTKVPFIWTATGKGGKTTANETWTVDATFSGNCPTVGCLQVLVNPDGSMSFTEIGQQIVVPMTTIVQQGATTFGAPTTEVPFPVFSGAPNQDPVGGFAAMKGPPVPPEPGQPACYAWETPALYNCTQTWSWHLSKQ
jgi:hypothetical protein